MNPFDNLLNDTIILERNIKEERNCNYTKIYDLSKIDSREDLSFEEKRNILIAIKKILLSTNLFFYEDIHSEITIYIITKIILFLFFIFIYCPLYKLYFYPSEDQRNSLNECSFWQKLLVFMVFYGMDSPKTSKENELMKIMNFYAQ